MPGERGAPRKNGVICYLVKQAYENGKKEWGKGTKYQSELIILNVEFKKFDKIDP